MGSGFWGFRVKEQSSGFRAEGDRGQIQGSGGSKPRCCKQVPRYRGISLIRNSASLGPYSRTTPRNLSWSYGGELFLMSEVTL